MRCCTSHVPTIFEKTCWILRKSVRAPETEEIQGNDAKERHRHYSTSSNVPVRTSPLRVAGEYTARRAGRVRQGEGRRLCVVAEHVLTASKYDGINHEPKLVHQPGCKQLAHHVAAAPRQQVGAVLLLKRAYRVGKVALQRMTLLPVKRIGSMRGHMLGHAVEQVRDAAAARLDRYVAIRRPYFIGATTQQQLERLRNRSCNSWPMAGST